VLYGTGRPAPRAPGRRPKPAVRQSAAGRVAFSGRPGRTVSRP